MKKLALIAFLALVFISCDEVMRPETDAAGTRSAFSNTPTEVSLNAGDILVADRDAFGGSGAVIRVDPVTGAQTTISSGGVFGMPMFIAIDANGDLLVTDRHVDAVIRVDPMTGAQTIVSSGGSFVTPKGIALDHKGDILVADDNAFGGSGAVIRVDPVTGAQTTVSRGNFREPRGIAIDANGDLIVVDRDAFGGAVFRVDPVTGAQMLVATGGSLSMPSGIAIDANGDLLVADHAGDMPGRIIRVDPVSGAQTIVSWGGSLSRIYGIAIDANSDLLVTDHYVDAVIRVDPMTGAQTIVSSGGSFVAPIGIAIVRVISVAIDMKPGSYPNSINLGSNGTIPVAVFSTETFDATTVDATTVTLADAAVKVKGRGTPMAAEEDVNGDGLMDLVVHVETQGLSLTEGDTEAVLTGTTHDGIQIRGTDTVRVVP